MLFKAQFLQKQTEELEQHLEIIDNEILDLKKYDSHLDFLSKSNEKSSISSIGKGIHMKTSIESKELLVEVGAGVVVKKNPEEARKVIQGQIKKLTEARINMFGKLEIYHKTMQSVMEDLEKQEKDKSQGHSHNHN